VIAATARRCRIRSPALAFRRAGFFFAPGRLRAAARFAVLPAPRDLGTPLSRAGP